MSDKAKVWSALVGRMMQHLMPRSAVDGEKLACVWAARVREVLPEHEFNVTVEGEVIRIKGIGSREGAGLVSRPTVALLLPLSVSRRLKIFCENASGSLQEFVTAARGEAWPAPDAQRHFSVGSDMVRVWWTGAGQDEIIVQMTPISRMEIGV
jgi:hypothetical protein